MDLLLDTMLGKLATYLRMCGYDAAYALDRGVEADDELLAVASDEDRWLLTRDVDLAGRAERSVLVESLDVREQLRELADTGFELSLADPPTRCGSCNGPLAPATDAARSAETPDEGPLWRCRDCGQLFWKGSHWDDVRETLAAVRADA